MAPRPSSGINGVGRNRESHLGSHSGLTPDFEVAADQLCALTHAAQAEMTDAIGVLHRPVHPSAIVPHPQLKMTVIVTDLYFDPPRACVPERIAQRLAANPINVVPDDRTEVARGPEDRDVECWWLCGRVARLVCR